MRAYPVPVFVFLVVFAVPGCAPMGHSSPGPRHSGHELTMKDLLNATYFREDFLSVNGATSGSGQNGCGRTLVDGKYAGGEYTEPYEGASVYRNVRITLQRSLVAWGDLDGDGDRDAAVVLLVRTGDDRHAYDLVAVMDNAGRAEPRGEMMLGDESEIDNGSKFRIGRVSVDDGAILVEAWREDPREPHRPRLRRYLETYSIGYQGFTLRTQVPSR